MVVNSRWRMFWSNKAPNRTVDHCWNISLATTNKQINKQTNKEIWCHQDHSDNLYFKLQSSIIQLFLVELKWIFDSRNHRFTTYQKNKVMVERPTKCKYIWYLLMSCIILNTMQPPLFSIPQPHPTLWIFDKPYFFNFNLGQDYFDPQNMHYFDNCRSFSIALEVTFLV